MDDDDDISLMDFAKKYREKASKKVNEKKIHEITYPKRRRIESYFELQKNQVIPMRNSNSPQVIELDNDTNTNNQDTLKSTNEPAIINPIPEAKEKLPVYKNHSHNSSNILRLLTRRSLNENQCRPEISLCALRKQSVRKLLLMQRFLKRQNGRSFKGPTTVGHATTMQFDRYGCLLATGATDGGLCIFNFDRSMKKLSSISNAFSRLNFSENATDLNETPNVESLPQQSIKPNATWNQMVSVRISGETNIQSLKWNPFDQNQIATGFLSKPVVHLYPDIEKTTAPPRELQARNILGSRGGTLVVEFDPSSNHLVFGGATTGHIRLWDTRQYKAQWEATPEGKIRSISALIPMPNGIHLYSATTCGKLILWDLRKTGTGFFGRNPTPPTIHSWQIENQSAVTSLKLYPQSTNFLVYQLNSGKLGVFDPSNSRNVFSMNFDMDATTSQRNGATLRFNNLEVQDEDHIAADSQKIGRNCMDCFTCQNVPTICASSPYDNSIYFIQPQLGYASTMSQSNNIVVRNPVDEAYGRPLSLTVHPTNYSVAFSVQNIKELLVMH